MYELLLNRNCQGMECTQITWRRTPKQPKTSPRRWGLRSKARNQTAVDKIAAILEESINCSLHVRIKRVVIQNVSVVGDHVGSAAGVSIDVALSVVGINEAEVDWTAQYLDGVRNRLWRRFPQQCKSGVSGPCRGRVRLGIDGDQSLFSSVVGVESSQHDSRASTRRKPDFQQALRFQSANKRVQKEPLAPGQHGDLAVL